MDGHSMVEIPMDYLHHSLESICYRYGHPTIIFVGFLVMGYLYNDYSTLLLNLLGTIPPAHGNVLTVVHVMSAVSKWALVVPRYIGRNPLELCEKNEIRGRWYAGIDRPENLVTPGAWLFPQSYATFIS